MLFFLPCDAMHSADYAAARCPFVCPSVRPSVTRRYCIETAKLIIKRFSPSGSPTILVVPYQTVFQYCDGASNASGVWKNLDFWQISRLLSEMMQNVNRKPYPSFRMVPVSMTLIEWPVTLISRSRYYSTSNNSKMVQELYLQWPTNRKSYMVYRTAPFSMTLNDP